MRLRLGFALCAAFLVVNLVETGAGAQVQRKAGGQCGTAPCWTTFTVNGGAPPAGVALTLTQQGAQIQVSLTKSGQTDLSPSVTTSDTIHMVLNVGTFDPIVFGTTGVISSYSESTGANNTITLDVKPSASSWNANGCTVQSCGSDVSPVTATNDFTSVALGFVSDLSTSGATQATKDAMRGTWFSTNAQSMTLPSFNASTGKVSFTVAAPHFMTNGTTLNTGFFKFFAPDALVQSMGIADPTTVSNGTFTVSSSNNTSTSFTVTHQSSPAGVLINAPTYTYSSPTFTVAKTATAPGAPTGVSATRGDGQATVSFNAPASNGGAAISSYTVTASPGGATATGSSSPITVTGLRNGTSYTFAVAATNSVGTGGSSSASNAVTPAGLPDTPTGVSASAGDGSATVSFSAASDNGAAISSYTVTASPGGATASGSGSPITVTGLANCTSYTFTVTATNVIGTGGSSAASAAAVPSSAVCATVTTEGSATANVAGSLSVIGPPGAPASASPALNWTSNTFASDVSVDAVTEVATSTSTPPALSGFSAGSLAVELAIASGGSTVHTFGDPLEIVFPVAAPTLAPAYSDDGGTTWVAIPLLSGTTLSADQQDGYYQDAGGNVHVLTRHATYFGLINGLVLKFGNRPTFPVGSRRIFVFLAPARPATSTVVLETRSGIVLKTLTPTLPAGTTHLAIPLPPGLKAGLYLVKVTATSGPGRASATLLVRLVSAKH